MMGYIVAGVALAAALGIVMIERWRTVRTVKRLDRMLEAAIAGCLQKKPSMRVGSLRWKAVWPGIWQPVRCLHEKCKSKRTRSAP